MNAPDPDHPTEKRKFIIKHHPRYPRNVWFLDPELKQYQKLDCDPRTAGGDGTDWDRNLVFYSGYRKESLLPLCSLWLQMVSKPMKQEAVFKKYAHRKFYRVSTYVKESLANGVPEL